MGRIVNISSSSTYSGTPRMAAYVSSKSAINGLTKTLAREVWPSWVTVNAIPPSFIDTPMLRASAAAGDLDVQASIATTPVRRQGLPEDIAAACSFLCRDEASYIHRPDPRGRRGKVLTSMGVLDDRGRLPCSPRPGSAYRRCCWRDLTTAPCR